MRLCRVVRVYIRGVARSVNALLASILLVGLLAAGCNPVIRPSLGGHQVVLRVDGQDISHTTGGLTVREALAEAGVTLGTDDRVEPDLWVEVQEGMAIRVIRVQEETIVERELPP